jgi:hypothetical protein
VWADGIYLTAWPRVSSTLPFLLLLTGFVEGAAHWGLLTIGDGAVSAHIPAVTFAQMLPLIFIASVAGSFSANLGLMLVLGYALGDFLVAGPQFPWAGGAVAGFFHLRVPQLVSYALFAMLAVQPILVSQALTRSLRWLLRRRDAVSRLATLIIAATLQGVLVYGWTLAAPMVIRILWSWARATPPITFTYFSEETSTWVPVAAAVAALAREILALRAASRDNVLSNIEALARACHEADEHPAFTRRIPAPARAMLAAVFLTLLISGFIATLVLGVVIWALVSGALIARAVVLARSPAWNQWAGLAQNIPLLFRWSVAMAASYLLARGILAMPGQAATINSAAGAFQAELVSLALGLITSMALLPGPPQSATENRRGSKPHSFGSAIAGLAILVLLTAPTAYAVCLDPFCCFGTNDKAALAVMGMYIVSIVGLLVLAPAIALVGILGVPLAYFQAKSQFQHGGTVYRQYDTVHQQWVYHFEDPKED